MARCRRIPAAAIYLLSLIVPLSLWAHGPSEKHGEATVHDEAAMKAQHERMGHFLEAMQGLSNAIIMSDLKSGRENAAKLAASLKGTEKDAPHKNQARRKEFKGLYAELDKRVSALDASLKAGDLAKGGAAYGKLLEACAACHRKFRD